VSSFYHTMHYSAKRGLAIVCPSVTLVYHDHIDWKSWKLVARTISPTSSLFVARRSSTYSQGNMEKFWGENVRSTPTSITSVWIESTESHVILGGGVAVCLLLSAHRAVIFAIAQLSRIAYFLPLEHGVTKVLCASGQKQWSAFPRKVVTHNIQFWFKYASMVVPSRQPCKCMIFV